MSLVVTTKEGMIEHVEPIENESATLFGGDSGAGTDPNRSTRRAFSKRANSGGTSTGNLNTNQEPGNLHTVGSAGPSTDVNDGINIADRRGEELEQSGSGYVDGSGSEPSRGVRNRYGIEGRRDGETPDEYKRRYKREYRAAERAASKRAETEERMAGNQEVDLEEETGFSLTVEAAPIVDGESLEVEVIKPSRETSAKPRAKKGSKYKEPSKDMVSFTASMIKDMYNFSDGSMMLVSTLLNKFYVPGTMEIEDEKAEKIAHALVRMNNSLPQWAEKINKFSAPMTLVSVLLPDLIMKGMAIRGQWATKQPANPHN